MSVPVLSWLLSVDRAERDARWPPRGRRNPRSHLTTYRRKRLRNPPHRSSRISQETHLGIAPSTHPPTDPRQEDARETSSRQRWAVRPTQPSEPILLPKLRIQVADFPYPHSSKPLEAANLGDLMRIWVRSGAECIADREADFKFYSETGKGREGNDRSHLRPNPTDNAH